MRKKKTARAALVLVAGLWIATVWALSVGAVEAEPEADQVYRTHCELPMDPEAPCNALGQGHTNSASPTGSATPSKSPTPSSSPSSTPSRSSTPSSSPSPSRSSSPSPSPSPSQTTPPPPSVREFDSRISIKYGRGSFKGRVTSESARCVGRRSVVVKKVKPGKDAVVGRDQTGDTGRYKVREPRAKGRYYAKVTRRQFQGNGNTTIRCNSARSRTIRP